MLARGVVVVVANIGVGLSAVSVNRSVWIGTIARGARVAGLLRWIATRPTSAQSRPRQAVGLVVRAARLPQLVRTLLIIPICHPVLSVHVYSRLLSTHTHNILLRHSTPRSIAYHLLFSSFNRLSSSTPHALRLSLSRGLYTIIE